jgi:hypothetical protein
MEIALFPDFSIRKSGINPSFNRVLKAVLIIVLNDILVFWAPVNWSPKL